MMNIHYYLTVFPMEAMIASQLEPEAFGAYMAVGNRKGSAEMLTFFELIESELGDSFDLDYARRRCVGHSDGRLKNSVYLSVYRALEKVPVDAFGALWLITKDGRSISLEQSAYTDPDSWEGNALYQELCPAHPLVISALKPKHFAEYIVEDSTKVTMPAIFFAELTTPDFNGDSFTGNIGGYYDKMMEHLKYCIAELKDGKGKLTKVVDRSSSAVFNFQVIGRGLYIGASGGRLVFYPMLSREELKKNHYDWAKSASIF